LRLNYRTPEETRRWASSILEGVAIDDMDGSFDSSKGYRSIISGPEPEFKPSKSFDDEIKIISDWIKEIDAVNKSHVVCVAVKSNADRKAYAKALKTSGITIHEITDIEPDIADSAPARLITMHRIKGLEFDHVCLAGLQNISSNSWSDERLEREKCLLHVAATRTKNSLLVTAKKGTLLTG